MNQQEMARQPPMSIDQNKANGKLVAPTNQQESAPLAKDGSAMKKFDLKASQQRYKVRHSYFRYSYPKTE